MRFLWAAALATLGPVARADDEKAECISASDQGQQLRDDGKYTLAREAFARCSRESCPVLVRSDCSRWLVDIEQTSASVVINAKDDKGNDLVDVTVTVDGQALVSTLDGKPLSVDPGAHTFRYTTAGFPPVEERLVVHAAEKNRALIVRFGAAPVVAPEPPRPVAPVVADRPASHGGGPPLPAWVFAGVAVASFGTEAYFGISGLSQRGADLGAHGCAATRTCAPPEKNDIQTKFVVADVSLGVGIASAALATFFFLRPAPPEAPAATAIDIAPLPGGCVGSLRGRF